MFYPLVYPYQTPQYLTEAMFVNAGFYTGTATNFQINLAFTLAEIQLSEELLSYLSPTRVTSPLTNFGIGEKIYLPVGNIIEVENIVFYERDKFGETRLISGTSIIDNSFYGAIRLFISPFDESGYPDCYGCSVNLSNQNSIGIYQADVTYVSGYPSGTHLDVRLQMALAQAADLNLKTLRDEGELADEAHSFIRSYSIGRYSQTVESKWARTTRFGTSNKAQYISNLIDTFRIKRARMLGR